jgi:hypothetical protein
VDERAGAPATPSSAGRATNHWGLRRLQLTVARPRCQPAPLFQYLHLDFRYDITIIHVNFDIVEAASQ